MFTVIQTLVVYLLEEEEEEEQDLQDLLDRNHHLKQVMEGLDLILHSMSG